MLDKSQLTPEEKRRRASEKTILIVEDNELNMKLFHDLIQAHGYNILQTKDGMEALKLARQLAAPDATLSLTRAAFFKMLLAKVPLPKLVEAGEASIEGNPKALGAVLTNLMEFDPLFNIVTP